MKENTLKSNKNFPQAYSEYNSAENLILDNKKLKQEIRERKETEIKLRKNEERYKALFENNPISTIIVNHEGRVTDYNLAKGESGSRIPKIGDLMYRDYAGKHQINMFKELIECMEAGQSKEFPEQLYKDKFLHIRISPFSGGAIITSIDITHRKRVERALRESEERYRALFDNNPIDTIIVDHEARITGYNFASSISEEKVPALGCVMFRDFKSKHSIDMYSELMECICSGKPKEFPEQLYKDRFLYIRISPFSGGAIITSIDISYRKKVEAALRESEKRYRALVETIPHGIQEIDTRGVITFANSALENIFGFGKGELIGKSIFDLLASDHEKQKTLDLLSRLLGDKPQPFPFLNKCIKRKGQLVDIQTDWNYKLDKQGEIIGFISIITDISNRIKAEKDKKKLENQLHYAQKMEAIGTLAGGIAHDFNNILGSIMLNTELAIDDIAEEGDTRYSLDQVLKGSHRARELIEQILTFSREAEVERRPLKIGAIVKETLKMLRAMLPATIIIQQDIASDLETILADPTQIQQLVMNLCNNASHAMKESGGKLKVILKNTKTDAPPPGSDMVPGACVKLSVSDKGCGIKKELIDRIFDPFFTTKRPGEGTGLGLSVVHGIIINHEGAITLESSPGKGTTFHVFLPVIKKEEIFLPGKTHDSVPRGSESILFVDDEEVVVDANRRILERLGYKVVIAANGTNALKIFSEDPFGFDLVITDMTMPNMTGTQLSEKLIKLNPQIPIILCTGFSQLITPEKAIAIGIREFIMKPFDRRKLAETIRKVLDRPM